MASSAPGSSLACVVSAWGPRGVGETARGFRRATRPPTLEKRGSNEGVGICGNTIDISIQYASLSELGRRSDLDRIWRGHDTAGAALASRPRRKSGSIPRCPSGDKLNIIREPPDSTKFRGMLSEVQSVTGVVVGARQRCLVARDGRFGCRLLISPPGGRTAKPSPLERVRACNGISVASWLVLLIAGGVAPQSRISTDMLLPRALPAIKTPAPSCDTYSVTGP